MKPQKSQSTPDPSQPLTTGDKTPRSRGRPRQFDKTSFVRKAQLIFWQAGYEPTSLGGISLATGIHKPSLYAAFKDKAGLFLETLTLYFEETEPLLTAAFGRQSLRAAIECFLMTDIEVFTMKEGRGGCYFINIFDEAARNDVAMAAVAQAVWARIRARIEARVSEADSRELPVDWSRAAVSDLVLATHVLLAVRSRAGASRSELDGYVARIIDCFPDANAPGA